VIRFHCLNIPAASGFASFLLCRAAGRHADPNHNGYTEQDDAGQSKDEVKCFVHIKLLRRMIHEFFQRQESLGTRIPTWRTIRSSPKNTADAFLFYRRGTLARLWVLSLRSCQLLCCYVCIIANWEFLVNQNSVNRRVICNLPFATYEWELREQCHRADPTACTTTSHCGTDSCPQKYNAQQNDPSFYMLQ